MSRCNSLQCVAVLLWFWISDCKNIGSSDDNLSDIDADPEFDLYGLQPEGGSILGSANSLSQKDLFDDPNSPPVIDISWDDNRGDLIWRESRGELPKEYGVGSSLIISTSRALSHELFVKDKHNKLFEMPLHLRDDENYDVLLSHLGDFCVVHHSMSSQFSDDFVPHTDNEYCFRVLPKHLLFEETRIVDIEKAYAFDPPFSPSCIRTAVLSTLKKEDQRDADEKEESSSKDEEDEDTATVIGIHVVFEQMTAITIDAPKWEKILFVVQQIVQRLVPFMGAEDLIVTLPTSKAIDSYDRGTVSERVAVVLDHAQQQFSDVQCGYELQFASHSPATFGGRIVLGVEDPSDQSFDVPVEPLYFSDFVIVIGPDLNAPKEGSDSSSDGGDADSSSEDSSDSTSSGAMEITKIRKALRDANGNRQPLSDEVESGEEEGGEEEGAEADVRRRLNSESSSRSEIGTKELGDGQGLASESSEEEEGGEEEGAEAERRRLNSGSSSELEIGTKELGDGQEADKLDDGAEDDGQDADGDSDGDSNELDDSDDDSDEDSDSADSDSDLADNDSNESEEGGESDEGGDDADIVISVVSVNEEGDAKPECIEEVSDGDGYDALYGAAHKIANCILARNPYSRQHQTHDAHESPSAEQTEDEEKAEAEGEGEVIDSDVVEFELTLQNGECCFIRLSHKSATHQMFRRNESHTPYVGQQVDLLSANAVRLKPLHGGKHAMRDIIFYLDQVDNFQMFEHHDLGVHSKVHMFHHLTYSTNDKAFAPRGLWFLCASWTQSHGERKSKCTEDLYFNAGFLLFEEDMHSINQMNAQSMSEVASVDPSGMLQLESLHLSDIIESILKYRHILNEQSVEEQQIQDSLTAHRLAGKELTGLLVKIGKMYDDTAMLREKMTVDVTHLTETLAEMTKMLDTETAHAEEQKVQLEEFKLQEINNPLDRLHQLEERHADANQQVLHLKYSADEHAAVMRSLELELNTLQGQKDFTY